MWEDVHPGCLQHPPNRQHIIAVKKERGPPLRRAPLLTKQDGRPLAGNLSASPQAVKRSMTSSHGHAPKITGEPRAVARQSAAGDRPTAVGWQPAGESLGCLEWGYVALPPSPAVETPTSEDGQSQPAQQRAASQKTTTESGKGLRHNSVVFPLSVYTGTCCLSGLVC